MWYNALATCVLAAILILKLTVPRFSCSSTDHGDDWYIMKIRKFRALQVGTLD